MSPLATSNPPVGTPVCRAVYTSRSQHRLTLTTLRSLAVRRAPKQPRGPLHQFRTQREQINNRPNCRSKACVMSLCILRSRSQDHAGDYNPIETLHYRSHCRRQDKSNRCCCCVSVWKRIRVRGQELDQSRAAVNTEARPDCCFMRVKGPLIALCGAVANGTPVNSNIFYPYWNLQVES